MPDYRRKKTHTGKRKRTGATIQKPPKNIPVRRSKNIQKPERASDENIRVVKGGKGEKRKKLYIFASTVLVLALIIVILSAIAPVSLFESAQDFALSIGSGSYPAEISGSGAVNCVPNSRYYYVLTDTSIMAFTNGGKKIFSFVHGFSAPVLVTSQTRALLFDQGKNSAVIYNLSGVIKTIESKQPIIAGDIAKDGEYALVTKSESYAATVSVYDRSGNSLYSINFAKDMVNNVDIASSGKKMAVSTVNSESGRTVSSVRVYDFNSADPAFKLDLGEELAYDIENTGSGFFVTTHKKTRYIKWSDYSITEYDFGGEVGMLRYSDSGFLALYNKTNDKSDNTVTLFTDSGKKISEFEIKGAVNDIRFSRGRVYIMSDSKITIYDRQGEILRSGNHGFGGVKMAITGSDTVCIVTDNEIEEAVIKR
ncbi:MAG: hypothetical protein J5852_02715 [Clostridia bacterium]|nr:hypothetical protein [Clostridia bacterium]